MKERFNMHIDALEEIMAMFKAEPETAAKKLAEERTALEKDAADNSDELFNAACYNALATIRTSLEQEKPTGQLISAIADAREELMVIRDTAV